MNIIIISLLILILLESTYVLYKTKEPKINTSDRIIFVDTSVLMDGRILNIAKSGFLPDGMVIPRSVIRELQFLADNSDHDKRSRARYGLDVAHDIRTIESVDVGLFQDSISTPEGVDNRLLSLARKYGGSICTIDYNLNKVAKVEDIDVYNVNELSKDLRVEYLPGESASIKIIQKGQDDNQGIGYLGDGTMVVIERASGMLNKIKEVEFTRSLQTDAGRMMFAKLKQQNKKKDKKHSRHIDKDKPKKSHISKAIKSKPKVPRIPRPSNPTKRKDANSTPAQNHKSHEDKLLDLVNRQ